MFHINFLLVYATLFSLFTNVTRISSLLLLMDAIARAHASTRATGLMREKNGTPHFTFDFFQIDLAENYYMP